MPETDCTHPRSSLSVGEPEEIEKDEDGTDAIIRFDLPLMCGDCGAEVAVSSLELQQAIPEEFFPEEEDDPLDVEIEVESCRAIDEGEGEDRIVGAEFTFALVHEELGRRMYTERETISLEEALEGAEAAEE